MFGVVLLLILFALIALFVVMLAKTQKAHAATKEMMANSGMNVTYKYEGFLLDENSGQWTTSGGKHIFQVSDITGFKYVETGASQVSMKVDRIEIIIYTSVPECPTVILPLTYQPVDSTSMTYRTIRMGADTFIGKLRQVTGINC